MKYNIHIENITSKASWVLGFIKRNLRHCPKTIKESAYHTLVRPELEYSSPIWNPQQKNPDQTNWTSAKNAARFVLKKPFNYQNPTSVNTSMLSELKWPTLEQHRSSFDLIFMYKIVHQLVAVPTNYLPVPSPRYNMDEAVYICNTNSLVRNNMKLVTYHCKH